MTTNPGIESSRRIYGGLLNLLPREFRDEFGQAMLQLFSDQCRAALRSGGTKGVILLWIRTLGDLAVSALREHTVSPRVSLGLLEGVPNEPLPWKGVVLVMIPGLVFFIGQIGQLAGEDWFFLLVRRAAYYLIVPVLLIWVIKRKFPVWGLIPLAMIYRTLIDVAFRLDWILEINLTRIFTSPSSLIASVYEKFPPIMNLLNGIRIFLKNNAMNIRWITASALVVCAVVLILYLIRRRAFTRAAGVWLGVFLLIALGEAVSGVVTYVTDYRWTLEQLFQSATLPSILKDVSYSAYYSITGNLGFLALILIGALAARRHGRLALLLPVGYLIPAVVLGKFDFDPQLPYLLIGASAAALIYRIVVTIVAPVWIVRSASERAQRRAGTVGLLVAVGVLVAAHFAYLVTLGVSQGWALDWADVYYYFSPEIITLSGIALAISIYKPVPAATSANPTGAAVLET
jgi:hypothetical protein